MQIFCIYILTIMIRNYILSLLLLTVFGFVAESSYAQGSCGTPVGLQVSVAGNQVTFSWTGTGGADIHAILLRNEQTGENSKGYSSVGAGFATMTVPPGIYKWRVKSLCNTAARTTEDASEWVWGGTFTMVKTNVYIPQAHAGCDQTDVPGTSTGLSAMSPLDGTGQWKIVSGAGGSFSDASSPVSAFTGISGTTYILRWTVSNESGSTFHDVLVRFCAPPSQADAGTDQLNLYNPASLAASGTGLWTIVNGEGGIFSNPLSATSTFTGVPGRTYVLRWIVSNACGINSDDVTVNFADGAYLNPVLTYGAVADIEGNNYATIQIGTQTWMAENLRTATYNDGTPIPNVNDGATWGNLTTGAWSHYNNDVSYNVPYGKLYNWYAVNTGKLCPQGWRIPTIQDLVSLSYYENSSYGGLKATGNKTDGTGLWKSPNSGATNNLGFSGLPGGMRWGGDGSSFLMDEYGYWWVDDNTQYGGTSYMYFMAYNSANFSYQSPAPTIRDGYSCRCVKD